MSRTEVILPEPKPLALNPEKSALLVLDIGQRRADPGLPCHELANRMIPFLARAREAGILIIFTISAHEKGTPNGQVYALLERRPSEAVIFPDSFKITKLFTFTTLDSIHFQAMIAEGGK